MTAAAVEPPGPVSRDPSPTRSVLPGPNLRLVWSRHVDSVGEIASSPFGEVSRDLQRVRQLGELNSRCRLNHVVGHDRELAGWAHAVGLEAFSSGFVQNGLQLGAGNSSMLCPVGKAVGLGSAVDIPPH